MIDTEELLFVVNEKNEPLEPLPRSYVHKHVLWHRSAGVWVINDKKQVLCQKRSLKKDVKPGMWEAFFGGHLGPGEDYRKTAAKEVSEELGTPVNENELIPYKILKSDKPTHKEFQHLFAFKLIDDNTQFNFEKEEVDQLKWIAIEDLKNILGDKDNNQWVHKPWDEEILNWLASY